nr:STAS-like domain-containing protein [uncultured Anaerobutyricum sp.]
MTTTINIIDYANGDTATSYEDGQRCLKAILQAIDSDIVRLDFMGVNFVITAFLNPIIGDLILLKGPSIMRKIEIINANTSIIQKIKLVKDGSLLKREDIDE